MRMFWTTDTTSCIALLLNGEPPRGRVFLADVLRETWNGKSVAATMVGVLGQIYPPSIAVRGMGSLPEGR